jgi:lysozyme
MSTLADRVKQNEGFRNKIYKDTLGFATIGYGHKVVEGDPFEEGVEYPKEQLEEVFKTDLDHAQLLCENMFMCDLSYDPPELLKEIYTEMIFQLGPGGVSKFKNASIEMLDSRWNKQTPNRAKHLSDLMATLEV